MSACGVRAVGRPRVSEMRSRAFVCVDLCAAEEQIHCASYVAWHMQDVQEQRNESISVESTESEYLSDKATPTVCRVYTSIVLIGTSLKCIQKHQNCRMTQARRFDQSSCSNKRSGCQVMRGFHISPHTQLRPNGRTISARNRE